MGEFNRYNSINDKKSDKEAIQEPQSRASYGRNCDGIKEREPDSNQ